MTKSDLILALTTKTGFTHVKCEMAVNAVFNSMTDALLRGDRIEVRGFGMFEVRNYGGYVGRNPRSGEPISVAAKRMPFFKPGKDLKLQVRAKA